MKEKTKITLRQAQGDAEQRRSITKEMTIGEVIKKYPKTAFLFIDYGLHCVGCPIAQDETIKEAAKAHRLDLEKFLEDLNKVIEKSSTAPRTGASASRRTLASRPATHQKYKNT